MKMQKADIRVLEKAEKNPVMIIGGFGGSCDVRVSDRSFDSRPIVERNIVRGLLRPGEYANQYELSEKGVRLLSEMRAAKRKKKEKSGAVA